MRPCLRLFLHGIVAPPCGERGLKFPPFCVDMCRPRRSPLRGAWIEIAIKLSAFFSLLRRSPLRGAWIEIDICRKEAAKNKSLPLAGSVD